MFHYLGLLIILCTWTAGLFLIRKTHDENLQTISKHAVSSVKTSLVFATAMITIGVLFYWWLLWWLKPHLALSAAFTVVGSLTTTCQIAIGLFPDTHGWVQQVHRLTAYSMAVLFLPLAVLITLSSQLLPAVQILCALLVLYMFTSFFVIVIMRKVRKYYLFFQTMYIVAFDVIILLAAYVPTKV